MRNTSEALEGVHANWLNAIKFFDRDGNIASVMENEVLSKHRKALMLFGTFHLMHGATDDAVASYEKHYPNVTFVIEGARSSPLALF
jgi:hypothetical protein